MKNLLNYRRKKRAISPVIATVLLIGLVVIAGLGVALVMFGTINTPDPLKIEFVSISSFDTTDGDYKVDQFKLTLNNPERTRARLEADAFTLYDLNKTEIPGWEMKEDQSEIIISALESRTITLACDNTLNQFELEPGNTTIYIDVTAYPAESNNPRTAKTFRSDILAIGDTVGPVSLHSTTVGTSFDQNGLTLNFSVTNNGSTDLELRLEFFMSSEIYLMIDGVNSTIYSFTVDRFKTTLIPDTLFLINTTSEATLGEKYLVMVSVVDIERNTYYHTENLFFTYEL